MINKPKAKFGWIDDDHSITFLPIPADPIKALKGKLKNKNLLDALINAMCKFFSGVIARNVFCDEAILWMSKRLLRLKSRLAMTRNLHIVLIKSRKEERERD